MIVNIQNLIIRVNENTTGFFRRESELIALLPHDIAIIIGDSSVYLSEFIIAKIKGKIKEKIGHPEITDELLLRVPDSLSNPVKILEDNRNTKKYLFINIEPIHEIVVEICRKESHKTEINTIHLIGLPELQRLERKFPVVYSSSGGTP